MMVYCVNTSLNRFIVIFGVWLVWHLFLDSITIWSSLMTSLKHPGFTYSKTTPKFFLTS